MKLVTWVNKTFPILTQIGIDGTPVQVNSVYTIPINTYLSTLQCV